MLKTVTKIVKEFSNSQWRDPVAWLQLECGHTGKAEYEWGKAHDDAAHKVKPGDSLQCDRCDWYADRIAQLKAMKPGDIKHSRFRTRDSRGFGDGDYYVYGWDKTSPTGCHLLFSVEATKEAGDLLSALRAGPLSPTERA